MIGFPVETGVIGRDEIDQIFDFLLGSERLQFRAILVVGSDSEVTEALAKTVGNQRLLVRTEVDPTVLIDQIHDDPVSRG